MGTPSSCPQYVQWMSPRTKVHYLWSTQEQTGTCATPWSPHQPSWKVHWHFQVSSYFWTKRRGPKFPLAPLVPHSATVPRYPKHAAHLPPPPSYVILHTHEWPFLLQCHAHITTGDKNISLWNTTAAQNLGSAWFWCFVYWVLPRPLPLPKDVCTGYPGRTNFPHCLLFPSQICIPSKKSPGWHSPLHPWSDNRTPTPLPTCSSPRRAVRSYSLVCRKISF